MPMLPVSLDCPFLIALPFSLTFIIYIISNLEKKKLKGFPKRLPEPLLIFILLLLTFIKSFSS